MTEKSFVFGDIRSRLMAPDGDIPLLIHIIDDIENADAFYDAASRYGAGIAVTEISGWDELLSPWIAPAAFKGSTDFCGKADVFLRELTGDIVPRIESSLTSPPRRRAVGGYSLAGLFALYSFWRTDAFDAGFSASGSMWYDGFTEYIAKNDPVRVPDTFCFSLGDTEHRSRSPRLASVLENTFKAFRRTGELGAGTTLVFDRGGHFTDETARVCDLIAFICGTYGASPKFYKGIEI